MLNTTFTKKVVDSILDSFSGDYIGFQGTVQTLSGPHPGPHRILGGGVGTSRVSPWTEVVSKR